MNKSVFDPLICRQCGGMCCQGQPGLWVDPQRFEALFFPGRELSPKLLQAEMPRLRLELRRISGIPIPAPCRSSGGCIFLGDAGCTLEAAHRPCQCLALTPSVDTLLDGEIRCRMPPGYGTGQARTCWERFWMRQDPGSG